MKKLAVAVVVLLSFTITACAEMEKNAGKGAENIRKIPDNIWKQK